MNGVVQLINGLTAGGAEIFAIDLACSLQKRGIQSYIVSVFDMESSIRSNLENKLHKSGVQYHCLQKIPFKKDIKAAFRYFLFLKKVRPEVVHSHCQTPNWINGTLTYLFSKDIRRIATLHSVNANHTRWKLIDKISGGNWFHSTVCVSQAVFDTIKEEPNKKVIYVARDLSGFTNKVDTTKNVRRNLGISDNSLIFLNVGRMSQDAKNHGALIRAFGELPTDFDTHLVLMGDGPGKEKYERLAKDNGNQQRIHFLGNVADTAEVYASSDVFIMPSLWEGRPVSAMEAFVSGLPCVFSQIEPLVELSKGVSGVKYFSGTDATAIREGIISTYKWLQISRWRRPFAECEDLRLSMGIEKCLDKHLTASVYGI